MSCVYHAGNFILLATKSAFLITSCAHQYLTVAPPESEPAAHALIRLQSDSPNDIFDVEEMCVVIKRGCHFHIYLSIYDADGQDHFKRSLLSLLTRGGELYPVLYENDNFHNALFSTWPELKKFRSFPVDVTQLRAVYNLNRLSTLFNTIVGRAYRSICMNHPTPMDYSCPLSSCILMLAYACPLRFSFEIKSFMAVAPHTA